jgi:hypothetical protein
MNPSINAQLEELIKGSLSFSKQEKEKMISLLPTLAEEEKQHKIRILLQEKEQREENNKQYIEKIQTLNKQYDGTIDADKEIQKMNRHFEHQREYLSTVATVKTQENVSKGNDDQEAENILQNL